MKFAAAAEPGAARNTCHEYYGLPKTKSNRSSI
jgi:hypothetical protein